MPPQKLRLREPSTPGYKTPRLTISGNRTRWELSSSGFPWMIVCVCNRLNDTRIRAACEAGPACASEVYALCGVKRNCGRCQDTIAEMLEEARAETAQRERAA